MKKKIFTVLATFAALTLTSCGNNNPFQSYLSLDEFDNGEVKTAYQEYDNGKRIESISVSETSVDVNLSEITTYQINATYSPEDAFNSKLYYVSDNESIAKVDENGLVTLLDNGEVTISVSSDNDVSNSVSFNIYTPIEKISILPHFDGEGGYVLDINDSRQFTISYEPSNTSQKDVIWSVIDENGEPSEIASISDSGLLTVDAPPKETKNVINYVKAVSTIDETILAIEPVTINDERVYAEGVTIFDGDLDITGSTVELCIGESKNLSAEVTPENTTAGELTWASSDPTSVEISDSGVITAKKSDATVEITASIDGISASTTIHTYKIAVSSVSLTENDITINVGESKALSVTVLPEDASLKDVSYAVASGSNAFVSVDENGVVTGLKSTGTGTAEVVVTSSDNINAFDTCVITVTNSVKSIEISSDDVTIENGTATIGYGAITYTFEAIGTPSDADPFSVTWSSSDETIATVDPSTGVVTTNDEAKTGLVTLTATVSDEVFKSITLNVIKEASPFDENKQYLVGNRNFADSSQFDYEQPSWDDSDFAREMVSNTSGDSRVEAEWKLTSVELKAYNSSTEEGDQFKIRSNEYGSCKLNPASTNDAIYVDGNDNFTVPSDGEYNIYYQKLNSTAAAENEAEYWIYVETCFDGYYVVGNRDYHTGISSGTTPSWNLASKGFKLTKDTSTQDDQYLGNITFEIGDEFRIRNKYHFETELGDTYSFVSKIGGNFAIKVAGTYSLYFKPSMSGNVLYMAVPILPTSIAIDQTGPMNLHLNESTQLTATIAPSNSSYQNVVWTSSDDSVVSVTNGNITALAVGDATIRAAIKGYESTMFDEIEINALEFAWGIAGSESDWKLDLENRKLESATAESGALYTYKIADIEFAANEEWKVTNTRGEWVNNATGNPGVGLDLAASSNCCSITSDGNIKISTDGHYTVTLNIFQGSEKVGDNFVSGMQIIVTRIGGDPVVEKVLTLDPGVWETGGAKFAAYFFKSAGTETTWVMLNSSKQCTVPNGYDMVIFVRLKDTCTEPNWDDKWNQTANLNVPTDDNTVCHIDTWHSGDDTTPSTSHWGK